MPSDPWFSNYLPGSDPREIGVSTSKDGEGQIYGCAGAPPRCFCSNPLSTGTSGEEALDLGRGKGLFLQPVLSLECLGDLEVVLHSGKLGCMPRHQLKLKGTSSQLIYSSAPGKMILLSWCFHSAFCKHKPHEVLPGSFRKDQSPLCFKTCKFFHRAPLGRRALLVPALPSTVPDTG